MTQTSCTSNQFFPLALIPQESENGSRLKFRIVVQDSAISTPEIMLVTAVSGTTFTVVRSYEGSTVSAHVAGAIVVQVVTQGTFTPCFRNGRTVAGTSDSFGPNDNILNVNQSGGTCNITGPTGQRIICSRTQDSTLIQTPSSSLPPVGLSKGRIPRRSTRGGSDPSIQTEQIFS